MAFIGEDPNYKLLPAGEKYKQPDLFTLWYNKYVRGDQAPGRTFTPGGGAQQPTAAAPQPTAQTPMPGMPTVPRTPGIAPTPMPGTGGMQAPQAPGTEQPKSWMGNLNKGLQDPAQLGLLTTGLSMMATPPRAVPYSTAEIVGKAGLAGIGAYQQALSQKRGGQLVASREGLIEAQTSHYKMLDAKIQEDISTGKDRNRIYDEMVAAGAADKLAADRGIPVELAKIALHGAVVEGKGMETLMKPSDTITEGIATALGQPSLTGESATVASKTAGLKRTEKEHKPDHQMIRLKGGDAVLRDLNLPEVQKAIMDNDVELVDDKGKTIGQLVVNDAGDVTAVDKNTGKQIGKTITGIGKKTKKPGAGGAAGRERKWEHEEKIAEASLKEKWANGEPGGKEKPTLAEISEERQKLYPRSTTSWMDEQMEGWGREATEEMGGEETSSFDTGFGIPSSDAARAELIRRRKKK